MSLKGPVAIPKEYKWDSIPEILYEAPRHPGAKTDPIPYIEIPKEKRMPPVLFIREYRHTGEMEVGSSGQPEEVMEELPHKYVDCEYLFERIQDSFLIDQIRFALGMKSLKEARVGGEKILDRVFGKTTSLQEQAVESQEDRLEKMKEFLEKAKKDFQSQLSGSV